MRHSVPAFFMERVIVSHIAKDNTCTCMSKDSTGMSGGLAQPAFAHTMRVNAQPQSQQCTRSWFLLKVVIRSCLLGATRFKLPGVKGAYRRPKLVSHTCWPQCRNRYSDVVLVIMFNVAFPGWLDVHKQISAAYKPLFRQIVYTGFHRQVNCPEHAAQVPQPAIALCPVYIKSMAPLNSLDRGHAGRHATAMLAVLRCCTNAHP